MIKFVSARTVLLVAFVVLCAVVALTVGRPAHGWPSA